MERFRTVPEVASPTAIVVDDDVQIVDLVVDVLQEIGISTLGCTNASEAFWFIGRHQPRLIILDVQMPGVGGIELFEQLRADPALAQTCVIFLTANMHVLSHALPDYTSRGAVLIAKPFDVQDLLNHVELALRAFRPS